MTIRHGLAPVVAGSVLALFAAAAPSNAQTFTITNLVSNQTGVAPNVDPNLVNAWGMAHAPNGPLWVTDNGTGLATIYRRNTGQKIGVNVAIPGGDPTGLVFVPQEQADNDDFVIRENGVSGESEFIFVTESGLISGWNRDVDLTHAVTAVDLAPQHASFKGAAIAPTDQTLYVADFHNNLVRRFDDKFIQIRAFTDPQLPKRYAPFNVKIIQHNVFVAFAEREKGGNDEVDGPGLGYVDVFNRSGRLLKRLIANGQLNAPWGMTIAPAGFGGLDGALLVGNFGDGRINAYNPSTGAFLGTLQGSNNQDLVIDGLWTLESSINGFLEFAAGPNDESNGLVGRITPAGAKSKH
ncbi:MAG TPA: TIGR03118 family protein [Rhizomicrobium sp.]|jgi:uncharacterized protein (TIGR03118 family)|nr:TIGR03118 family protein [Rhizomicrobium sp.]